MGKSFLKSAPEQKGSVPACTGALFEITEIERTKTKEKKLRMYVIVLKIKEPKSLKGMTMRDYCVVGTEEDRLAKEQETWERSEGGPGKLTRCLGRAGVPIDDDDDEIWMEAAVGAEVVAPITQRPDRETGEMRSNVGLYFSPSDEDCPEIGLAEDDDEGGGKKKGKGAAAAAKKARGRVKDDDDEDDDEDDEEPKKKGKSKSKSEDDDDDKKTSSKRKPSKDDDEDDDEEPKRKKKGAAKGKKKDEDDDDD